MKGKRQYIIDPKIFGGFCTVEMLFLVVLKLIQLEYPASNIKTYLMFSATFLNALFMLLLVTRVKKAGKDMAITGIPLAIFTTLLADVFLVLTKDLAYAGEIHFMSGTRARMIGFFLFGIVQVIYAFYIGITTRRAIIRLVFYIAFIMVIYAIGLLTQDRFIACLSMTQLILNFIYAWIEHNKKRTRASMLFALGITVFFASDAMIMMRMLLPAGGLSFEIVRFMVWVLYIPAQIMLIASYFADRTDAKQGEYPSALVNQL